MTAKNSNPDRFIADQMYENGYVLLNNWRYGETTTTVGRSTGTVIDIRSLLPRSGIPTIQTLKPRRRINSSGNRYSGTYGLDEFPLHTDLAHWVCPPRYLMLRCLKGSHAVVTRLLSNSVLAAMLTPDGLHRALARPRRPGRNGVLCLLPLMFCVEGISGFRWDPLFLVPMNRAANRVAEFMSTSSCYHSKSVVLSKPGDTLIVDNWRCLHGRSKVSVVDLDRQIERIYLSEIYS